MFPPPEAPTKMSRVWWFEERRELRPGHHERAELDIPPVGIPSFWLVLHVFSTEGLGWRRSIVKAEASLQVPEDELLFDDAGKDETSDSATPGVVVSLEYPETDDHG